MKWSKKDILRKNQGEAYCIVSGFAIRAALC